MFGQMKTWRQNIIDSPEWYKTWSNLEVLKVKVVVKADF